MENLLSARKILNFNFKVKVFGIATVAFIGLVLAVRQPDWLSGGRKLLSPSPKENSSSFWAVYLDSGQIFYGKKDKQSQNYVTMSDVFYYQPGVRSPKPENIRIIKVGTEIHQPQDYIYINKQHIERQEQLTDDSIVVKAIEQYKEQN